jgi:predicted AlkP superfamily phosphohydrolase/phosphomutase
MTARHLVLGVDGGDLGLIEQLGSKLPALSKLMRTGAYAPLRTVMPCATLPNWTTFLTGTDPGVHGVFDFTEREGYRVRFTGGTSRRVPTVAARLDAQGLVCACIGFPGTWPPERLRKGVFISGWDSPVAFEADASFVWPPRLFAELTERFGPMRFDEFDQFNADTLAWHETLADGLVKRVARRTELALHLLETRAWDFFAFYFGESDTAAHHLWSLHDPASPRRPDHVTPQARRGLERVYVAIDDAIGRLHAASGVRVELTIVSDHGSGGSSDKVLYLNKVLCDAGLLRFRPGRTMGRLARHAKDLALRRLSPRLRQVIFRGSSSAMPGWLESRARFGAIDMQGTAAFSEELNYFPSVCFNVKGREPEGQIEPDEIPRFTRRLEDALQSVRDPWTGQRVVRRVVPREEAYRGPLVDRAPDVLIELELDAGYSYNLMPSSSAPAGTDSWRKLEPAEYLGLKGRSLPGSHRDRGIWIAAGPQVRPSGCVDASMPDATATLLARMNVALCDGMSGRVVDGVLASLPSGSTPLPEAPHHDADTRTRNDALVEARLRTLGYID